MTKKKRIVSLVLAVTVLFVVLYSTFYIAAEADHDCVGDNCPICYQIRVCQNTLKNVALAAHAAAFTTAVAYILCSVISACAEIKQSDTLVSLKVKLSN